MEIDVDKSRASKMMSSFSFIILTYNEAIHLPRLLDSIAGLNSPVFILDSGSTDDTEAIANKYDASFTVHPFENHPKQWDYALKNIPIKTPWIIALDADQIVTPELFALLHNFKDDEYQNIDGIYFNRKNYFKGKWIRFGGYYPKYMLKMFRYSQGFSDLDENMDHRFLVKGETTIWKQGHILEENLKENRISFWIDKHNRYSDLLAVEEVERIQSLRATTLTAKFMGKPNEHTAWLKKQWYKLPRYFRPALYFTYRMIFKLGILDGKTGILFHFLQGFWFRIIVDMKIEELLKQESKRD